MRITLHPSKPLVWWYNRRNSIDMNPPYQRRGRLWSASDKAYLVDSIINGFDVPKLYVADFQLGESSLNKNRLPYAIIDGKQRLEAIFDFFEGKIVLNPDFVWRADTSLKLGGLSLKDLKNSYTNAAESFETETVDVMSVVTDNEADINELFVRLNRSKPLSGAEIRNAMVGPVPDVIRNIAKHQFFLENIKFSVTRSGDNNAAAKILLCEFEGKLVNTKKSDLDNFAKNGKIDLKRLELAGRKCLDVLDMMQEVFLPNDALLSSAGPIPVYYWLARSCPFEMQRIMREFLLNFENDRQGSRVLQTLDEHFPHSPIFARYDTLNRSVNDFGSHLGRFEILYKELFALAESKLVA